MPAQTPASNLKAKSPSKNIQRGIDQSWGAQKGTTSPQEAIANQANKKPISTGGK